MNKTPLTQRGRHGALDRGQQPGRAVADDQQPVRSFHSADHDVSASIGSTAESRIGTAEVYGPFVNEELAGDALSPFRRQVVQGARYTRTPRATDRPLTVPVARPVEQLDDREVRGTDREQHLLASLLIWLDG